MDAKIRYLEGACFFCLGKTYQTWRDDCAEDFISDNTKCPICARNTPLPKPCGSCLNSQPYFTSTEVLFNYQYPGDYLIKAFKFNDRPELARYFAEKLTQRLKHTELLPETLIPVPLHKHRQRERGYNQSLQFASSIGNLLGIPVNTSLCHRIINTERQSSLPMKTRKKNVRGAFKLNYSNLFNHAVIVDDVITTGSTVNEIASLLKKSGCQRVDVWAIARTQF